jgi:hypothetical protein
MVLSVYDLALQLLRGLWAVEEEGALLQLVVLYAFL